MAAPKKKSEEPLEISVIELRRGEVTFNILGRSPLVFNATSEKMRHELLLPRGKLTAADKAANLKHDPLAEYRASVYRRRAGEDGATRLIFPASGLKKSIADAALDLPGAASKAKIGRLTWVNGTYVDIYGVPQLYMAVVRMADISRTPDIRTRAILPEWAAQVTVNFTEPILNATTIANLFAAGGLICGIGDYRQQKGGGSFGQFEQRAADDPDVLRILRDGGMAAQDAALEAEFPLCYDVESENLLAWFIAERAKRGQQKASEPDAETAKKSPRRKRPNGREAVMEA